MSTENSPLPKTHIPPKSKFARLNKTKLAAFIFLLFTLTTMYGIYIVVFQPFAAIPFDRPLWLKSTSEGLKNNQRRHMLNDIFNNYIKPGDSQTNVKGLLGEPYTVIYLDPKTGVDLKPSNPKSHSQYRYLIGPDSFGIDSTWLTIKFDHNGKFTEWSISIT
ncbi:MAG: hypothetical protein ABJA67_15210 [Chthonomonadales bacterium]